jgi:hypothetical protein
MALPAAQRPFSEWQQFESGVVAGRHRALSANPGLWLSWQPGDRDYIFSVNVYDSLRRFYRHVSGVVFFGDMAVHGVGESSGFRTQSDFDPMTDGQDPQRIC